MPVADFTSSVKQGPAPLNVQFTEMSQNADTFEWDFGDGNYSNDKNPTHTYSGVGNYTVNLTVSDGNSTDSKLATINVWSDYTYVSNIGNSGSGDGQLAGPTGVALDSSGNIYAVDSGNNRIQKFDSSGDFIAKWGTLGSEEGQFKNPYAIAIDSSGNLYVSDSGNDRIQKFDSNGNFVAKWGSSGSGKGQFSNPKGIAVDSSGNVYVVDQGYSRIQKFTSSGTFITSWSTDYRPDGIAVDSSGNVYVSST